MRALIAIMFLMTSATMFGQTHPLILFYGDSLMTDKHAFIDISVIGALGSDHVNNSFIEKMYLGGHISDEELDALVAESGERNRAGMDARVGMQWWDLHTGLFGNECYRLMVSVQHENHAYAAYTDDLFKLGFRGNSDFVGKRVELAPLNMQYQAFQKFGVGVLDQSTYSRAQLSFVTGQDFISLDMNRARMTTSSDLDSISLFYHGDLIMADPDKHGFGAGKGLGAALDLEWNLPMKDGEGWFGVAVYNLGFIRWNGATEHYDLDSTFYWTGVEINDLFDVEEDLTMPALQDTIGYELRTGNQWQLMPMDVRMRMLRRLNERIFIDAGIALQPYQQSIPELRVAVGQDWNGKVMLTEQISYGGYSGFRAGVHVRTQLGAGFIVQAGTDNVPGWISSRARGRDLVFGISRIF
ncbi:MAG: hypothetical protein RL220_1525 [Bacteroidota bacterium]